jgi:hypothetical protein
MRGLGRQCGRTGEDRCADLGERDPEPRPRATSTVRVLSLGIGYPLVLILSVPRRRQSRVSGRRVHARSTDLALRDATR